MFRKVKLFEKSIAEFFNAPYAIATDSCTHAIELCLRQQNIANATCPARTYISIPFTFEKCNITWKFINVSWKNFYYIDGTNIIDAAPYWKKNGYIPKTFMCISFQHKKHLKLGRGGVILCDNKADYLELSKMVYDGRDILKPWREENIKSIGYHYYMTPETAELGLLKLNDAIERPAVECSSDEYPYLPDMQVFK